MSNSTKPSSQSWPRVVAHADMDAFYAAIEQLDDPALRGQAVLVGGKSHRGVVLTASYEARPFGVGSAMPMATAKRKCPKAVIVAPRFERYRQISEIIMGVFSEFSPEVEALSLDEAFLDMTGSGRIFGQPKEIGLRIKEAIFEVTGGLTASIGLSGTKYVAKVASAHQKPDGLTIVPPVEAMAWLAPLAVSRLWGAGPKTQIRLHKIGLQTIGDVAAADPKFLAEKLGNVGLHFHALAHAEDPREVASRRVPKSIGSERTLYEDVQTPTEIQQHLRSSADDIARRLRNKKLVALGVRVKLKTSDFQILTRQRSLDRPSDVAETLYLAGVDLLQSFEHSGPFRLVGMAAFDLVYGAAPVQLDMFGASARQRNLECTIDQLNERFHANIIRRAKDLTSPSRDRLGSTLDFLDNTD